MFTLTLLPSKFLTPCSHFLCFSPCSHSGVRTDKKQTFIISPGYAKTKDAMVCFQRRKGDKFSASTMPYNSINSASQTCVLIRSGVYDILDASSTLWKCSYPRHPQRSRTMFTLARWMSLVWHGWSRPAVQGSKAHPPLLFTTFLA